jgi:hypothetical protein
MNWTAVEEAGKGWKLLADQAIAARDDITQRGLGPVNENWPDMVGDAAGRHLKTLADKYDSAGLLLNSVGMVVNGLANALEVAQDELATAIELADRQQFRVDDDGRVTWVGPGVPDGEPEITEQYERIRRMVADALEAAHQADVLVADELAKLTAATGITNPDDASGMNNTAARAQIQLISYAVPWGQPPEVVAAWWAGLSDAQRRDLKLAAPIDLHDLPGIPDDVKRELVGPGSYNRIEALRYARDHWDDNSLDRYENNCTHFVSLAMWHGGGAREYNDDDWLIFDSDTDWYEPGTYLKDSKPWSQAQASHDFWASHGQEVISNDVTPGDIVYWRNPDGQVHHAAVVSSVSPDGDIHYTQHTNSMRDGSLDGRLPQTEQSGGRQDVIFIRPNPDW